MDLINRQAAIDALDRFSLGETDAVKLAFRMGDYLKRLPSAQPERLTDDDFETIRIHLSAYKERLCNQHRWEEAEEYQRIIDRFMTFASAQPEIIRCRDCRWHEDQNDSTGWLPCMAILTPDEFYCGYAERRTDD